MKWIIQFFDYEEGSAARWHDLSTPAFDSREQGLLHVRELRKTDDEESLISYRVVEIGSTRYYSQPTDKGEY